MTRQELREHCERTVKSSVPGTKFHDEHSLVLELLDKIDIYERGLKLIADWLVVGDEMSDLALDVLEGRTETLELLEGMKEKGDE